MRYMTYLKRALHIGRIKPEVDATLIDKIEKEAINPKTLITRRNYGFVGLPAQLELSAQKKIAQFANKQFRRDAKRLLSIMRNIKLPDDQSTIKNKKADIKTELEVRDKIQSRPDDYNREDVLAEDLWLAKDELAQLILGKIEDKQRDWHYYEYDEWATNLYMATRLAPNYAAVKTVMNEIQRSDPNFVPRSVLDFGSGMGTTTWAVDKTWPNSVAEFMNVDISKEQQFLCENLLRGGKEFGEPLQGIFHRQYLPASNKVKYDLVVAAYSMLELPNADLRTNIIENLWHKTNDLLVIIERGTRGGFAVVNEARHLILDLSGHDVTKRYGLTIESRPLRGWTTPEAHVMAPCSHEFLCPRTEMRMKNMMDVCRFRTHFEPLELGEKKPSIMREDFSYVVLRKGPHPSYLGEKILRMPRVVERKKPTGGQQRLKMCCPNGHLAECTFTKGKHGKTTYNIAKSCDWGDLLPIKVID